MISEVGRESEPNDNKPSMHERRIWPAPQPLPDDAEPQPFPLEVLPDWLRSAIEAVQKAVQVSIEMPASQGLGAVATAAQGRVYFRNERYRQAGVIWPVTVLDSGERKSASVSHMKAPLEEWEAETTARLTTQINQDRAKKKVLEAVAAEAQAAAEKAAKTHFNTMGAATTGDRKWTTEIDSIDAIEKAAAAREAADAFIPRDKVRLFTSDATPESLPPLMLEQRGHISFFEDEAGPLDNANGKYSDEPNLPIYLKAHDGSSFMVDRRSAPAIVVPRVTLNMVMTIQPDAMRSLGKHASLQERGFLPRMLFTVPTPMAGYRDPDQWTSPPEAVMATYRQVLKTLADEAFALEEPITIDFTPGANEVLSAFLRAREPRLRPDGDLHELGAWADKMDGQLTRLAGLIAIARAQTIHTTITKADAEGAWTLIEYYVEHAKRAYRLLGKRTSDTLLQRILIKVRQKGWTHFTNRDLQRAMNSARHITPDQLEESLQHLEDLKYLQLEYVTTNQKRYRWHVNPAVHEATEGNH